MLHEISRWQGHVLLPIVLIALLLIIWLTRHSISVPCETSLLRVSVFLGKDSLDDFILVKEESQIRGPYAVKPNDHLKITGETISHPEKCNDDFLIDWEFAFADFSFSSAKISAETPRKESLEVTIGSKTPDAFGDDRIWIIEKDSSDKVIRQVSIRLKGE